MVWTGTFFIIQASKFFFFFFTVSHVFLNFWIFILDEAFTLNLDVLPVTFLIIVELEIIQQTQPTLNSNTVNSCRKHLDTRSTVRKTWIVQSLNYKIENSILNKIFKEF